MHIRKTYLSFAFTNPAGRFATCRDFGLQMYSFRVKIKLTALQKKLQVIQRLFSSILKVVPFPTSLERT